MVGPVRRTSSTSKARRSEPGYIPRPPNAWMIFRGEKEKELSAVNAALGITESQGNLSTRISVMWKAASEDVRKYYERQAEERKLEHKRQNPTYKYQSTRSNSQGTVVAAAAPALPYEPGGVPLIFDEPFASVPSQSSAGIQYGLPTPRTSVEREAPAIPPNTSSMMCPSSSQPYIYSAATTSPLVPYALEGTYSETVYGLPSPVTSAELGSPASIVDVSHTSVFDTGDYCHRDSTYISNFAQNENLSTGNYGVQESAFSVIRGASSVVDAVDYSRYISHVSQNEYRNDCLHEEPTSVVDAGDYCHRDSTYVTNDAQNENTITGNYWNRESLCSDISQCDTELSPVHYNGIPAQTTKYETLSAWSPYKFNYLLNDSPAATTVEVTTYSFDRGTPSCQEAPDPSTSTWNNNLPESPIVAEVTTETTTTDAGDESVLPDITLEDAKNILAYFYSSLS